MGQPGGICGLVRRKKSEGAAAASNSPDGARNSGMGEAGENFKNDKPLFPYPCSDKLQVYLSDFLQERCLESPQRSLISPSTATQREQGL